MRHRVTTKTFGRNTNQRKALFKVLVSAVVEHGQIETTEAKAKAIRGIIDKMIYKAQDGKIATRRVLAKFFGKRSFVDRLVDEIAPAMKDRVSGFTRIVRLANRVGDDAPMVRLELVVKPKAKVVGEEVKPKTVKKTEK